MWQIFKRKNWKMKKIDLENDFFLIFQSYEMKSHDKNVFF